MDFPCRNRPPHDGSLSAPRKQSLGVDALVLLRLFLAVLCEEGSSRCSCLLPCPVLLKTKPWSLNANHQFAPGLCCPRSETLSLCLPVSRLFVSKLSSERLLRVTTLSDSLCDTLWGSRRAVRWGVSAVTAAWLGVCRGSCFIPCPEPQPISSWTVNWFVWVYQHPENGDVSLCRVRVKFNSSCVPRAAETAVTPARKCSACIA